MKKLIYILLLSMILLLPACTGQTNTPNDLDSTNTSGSTAIEKSTTQEDSSTALNSTATETESSGDIVPLEGYDEIMLNISSDPKDMLEYMRGNIGSASTDEATNLVLRLELLQKNYFEPLTDKFFDGDSIQSKLIKLYPNGSLPNKADIIEDAKLKVLLADAYSNGFKIETAEGSYFPVIDYGIYKEFSTYISEDISGYYSLMAVESDKAPAKDGGLVISWEEATNRALAQQQFILTYGSSQKMSEVQALYNKYATFIFNGLPNTPDFSYDSKTLNSKLKDSLLKTVENRGDTLLETTIRDYLEVLKKSEYKLTEDVVQFRKSALETIIK